MYRPTALDIFYVSIYIAILCVVLFWHMRRTNGRLGVSGVILISYIAYPIVGAFWFFHTPILYGEIEALTLFPFLYLAAMLCIAMLPIFQYDRQDVRKIEQPSLLILQAFTVIFFLCALIQIPSILSDLTSGLKMLLADQSGGHDLYNDSFRNRTEADGVISNIPAIIFNIFSPLAFLFFFYSLSLGKRYRWMALCFGICVIIKSVFSLSKGQRTDTVMAVLNIIIAYWAVRPMLSQTIKKIVRITFIIFAIGISIPFMALTASRFGDKDGGVMGGIVYYIGEAPYYFNYTMDADMTRHGDRTCNYFKQLAGISVPEGVPGVRDAYVGLKINDSVFSTFVGDFVIDFGPWWALFIFVIFSFIFCVLTRPNAPHQIPFHRLILLFFAMSVCMQGGMYLFSYAFENNLQIIAILFTYVAFAADYYLRHGNLFAQPIKVQSHD